MWYPKPSIPVALLLFQLAGCPPAHQGNDMSMEEEIRAYVRTDVRAGFYSNDEILSTVLETLVADYREAEVRAAASRILTEEREKLATEQREWPPTTDYDRLENAFAALEASGIVTRQNFTDCGTCGAAEIQAEIVTANKDGKPIRGYVFFHQQDTEAAANGNGLCLSYGAVAEDEQAALTIAAEIVSALGANDLPTKWDGSWSKRICVTLKWQRRQE